MDPPERDVAAAPAAPNARHESSRSEDQGRAEAKQLTDPDDPGEEKGGCQTLQLPNSSRRQIPRANWNPSRLMRQVDMWEPRVLAGLTWNTPISASETDCDKLFSFFLLFTSRQQEGMLQSCGTYIKLPADDCSFRLLSIYPSKQELPRAMLGSVL